MTREPVKTPEARERERERQKAQMALDVKAVVGTPEGRRVLKRLLFINTYTPFSEHSNALVLAYERGLNSYRDAARGFFTKAQMRMIEDENENG